MIKICTWFIEPEGDKQIQADFSCEMNSDKTKIHESFETVGFDKTLLNPVLTDELINTENISRYWRRYWIYSWINISSWLYDKMYPI